MDKMLLVGLYQADMLIKEPDEYDGDDIGFERYGIPDNRKLIKEGEYTKVPTTIDLSNVDFVMAWKFGDIDAVKIVLKGGTTIYVNGTIDDFDEVWMKYKSVVYCYEWVMKELEENT